MYKNTKSSHLYKMKKIYINEYNDVNVNSDLSNKIGSMNIYILYLEKCFKGLAV